MIATHATEFAPLDHPKIRLYRNDVIPNEDEISSHCLIREIKDKTHIYALLQNLGMEPSKILFSANSIIWVEGPSELVYFRYWLNKYIQDKNLELVENFDYSFAMYGGGLIAKYQHDAPTTEGDDMINLLHNSPACIVIVDSDLNSNKEDHDEKITTYEKTGLEIKEENKDIFKPSIKRIFDEFKENNPFKSILLTTPCKEIENLLNDKEFTDILKNIYNDIEDSNNINIKVGKFEFYQDAISNYILSLNNDVFCRVDKNDNKSIKRKTLIGDKVKFAQLYVDKNLLSMDETKENLCEKITNKIIEIKHSYNQ